VGDKTSLRADGRGPDQFRPVRIRRRYTATPHGSVLIQTGKTQVLCTAMVEEGVPTFLRNSNQGWVTAEYAMLPGSTRQRKPRDSAGRVDGRGVEIRRLIGRAMRAAVNMRAFPGRTIWLDCDVLEADGGTRTASITGAYVALADALAWLRRQKLLAAEPLRCMIAAASVGIVAGAPMLDLCYAEDAAADVDMNVVMTNAGRFIEVQGTAEGQPFSSKVMADLLSLARRGVRNLVAAQKSAFKG